MAVIEAIETIYLEADVSSVEFSSIPATYEHLQFRLTARSSYAATGQATLDVQLGTGGGAVDTGTNYSRHYVRGSGTGTPDVQKATGSTAIDCMRAVNAYEASTKYSPSIMDILDYANANKNTTVQAMTFADKSAGGNPELGFASGLWDATGAVDRVKFTLSAGNYNFMRGSEFTLYGLKSS